MFTTANSANELYNNMEPEQYELPNVYPAERTNKRTTQARKEVTKVPTKSRMDGVWMPSIRRTRSGDKVNPEPVTKPIERTPLQPISLPNLPREISIPEPIPIDVRKDIESIARRNQDVIMADKENSERPKGGPRKSELSAQIDVKAMVQDILDTEVSFPIRNLLGASRELSSTFQDIIKPKNTPKLLVNEIHSDMSSLDPLPPPPTFVPTPAGRRKATRRTYGLE
ncbi:hypothetical protein BJ912DRAFT_924739 [Pholiota molesta]|nr:hypothetical protein BJ912DRAFT_924739 [Pholiota molesta]